MKFYEKSWFMWLMLVFFAPVGIFLMWKNNKFKPVTRSILTAVFAMLFIAIIMPTDSENETTKNTTPPKIFSQTTEQTASSTSETVETESTSSPSSEISTQTNPVTLVNVLRVIDGDTIEVSLDGKTEKIRLIGIDTPESVHPDASKNTEEGIIASEFTKSQLEGQQVQLEFDVEERDKYGRLLAYVWFNDVMFNKTLLSEGYAQVSTYPPNVKYVDDFTALEKQARELDKGFWASTAATAPKSSTSNSGSSSVNSNPVTAAYIGNANTGKFHRSGCSSVGQMNPSNKVTLSSRQEAINGGYVPCKRCNP